MVDQQAPQVPEPDEVQEGQVAPDFKLPSTSGDLFQLSAQRGKTVVVATFALAFTGG